MAINVYPQPATPNNNRAFRLETVAGRNESLEPGFYEISKDSEDAVVIGDSLNPTALELGGEVSIQANSGFTKSISRERDYSLNNPMSVTWGSHAFFNNRYFAVGYGFTDGANNSYISVSDPNNFSSWKFGVQTGFSDTNAARMVTGNGFVLAVRRFGTAFRSVDGLRWTTVASGTESPRDWAYDPSTNLLAVTNGDSSQAISYTTNGLTWTKTFLSNLSANPQTIAFGNNTWLANLQGNFFLRSTDNLVTWTTVSAPSAANSLRFYNGHFYYVSANDGQIRQSTNGSSWTVVRSADSPYTSARLAVKSDRIVAGVSLGQTGMSVAFSTNGTTWATPIVFSTTQTEDTSIFNNYVSTANDIFFSRHLHSFDGINWFPMGLSFGSSFNREFGKKMAYGAGKFVFGGRANNHNLIISEDGDSWTTRMTILGGVKVNAIAFGANRFVAVGASGRAAWSTNGTTWTSFNIGVGSSVIPDIAFGDGRFLIGANKTIRMSTNGTSWFTIDSSAIDLPGFVNNPTWSVEEIVYGGKKFWLTFSSATTSTGFDTYFPRGQAFLENVEGSYNFTQTGQSGKSAAYGAGTWVVVNPSQISRPMFSRDGGRSWSTSVTQFNFSSAPTQRTSVSYVGGQFFVNHAGYFNVAPADTMSFSSIPLVGFTTGSFPGVSPYSGVESIISVPQNFGGPLFRINGSVASAKFPMLSPNSVVSFKYISEIS